MIQILKGNILEAVSATELRCIPHGYAVLEDGILTGLYEHLPEAYAHEEVKDFGEALILQTFLDMHLHAPQFEMCGVGMDLPLLTWLDTHAFPTESQYADPAHARIMYKKLAHDLIHNGTTHVAMFSSLHLEGTLILMEELEKAGVSGYVGKVNMDQNAPDYLCERAEDSIRDTIQFVEASKRFTHIRPILTPRFAPSCSRELLGALGKIKQEYDLPVQSHLSENTGEMELVHTLFPECEQYWEVYDKYGLLDERTLMAHCVHCDSREREALRKRKVKAVHCADSNNALISGMCPVTTYMQEGNEIYLGSDVAGGSSLSMFRVLQDTIRCSKDRRIASGWTEDFLTVPAAYYLATSAPASFFGRKPGFGIGDPFCCMVVEDTSLGIWEGLTLPARLGRCIFRCDDRNVKAVFAEGKQVF